MQSKGSKGIQRHSGSTFAEQGLLKPLSRHVPHEATLQQLQLFCLTHRRICGDLISMFKITHEISNGVHLHPFNPQRATRPRQRCCTHRPQYALSIRAIPFWNKVPAKIVNTSSAKSIKALLDPNQPSLFLEVPISLTSSHNQSNLHTLTHLKTSHQKDHFHIHTPLHLVVYVVLNAYSTNKTDLMGYQKKSPCIFLLCNQLAGQHND